MTNRYYGQSVWLQCTSPSCDAGTLADPRHVANLTASGGWECHQHGNEEVPC